MDLSQTEKEKYTMSKKQYNVNRDVEDTFYRYKMPAILAKVEGQGNGIKTVIVNMVDIARALNREPVYPTKFFGIELGAQTQIDKVNDRYIVNGSHDGDKLQDILDGYIKKFVLCQVCQNPETELSVARNCIFQKCKACGNKGQLRSMGHGLANVILKQHKNMKNESKRNKKDGKTKEPTTTKDIYKGEGVDTGAVAKKVNGREKKDEWEGGDDGWGDSDSDDDEAAAMANLSLREMKPSDMTAEQKGLAFEEYFQELIDEGKLDDMMKAKERIDSIVLKAEYYGVKTKAPFVMFEKLFNKSGFEHFDTVSKKYRGLLCYINLNTDRSPDLKAMKYTINAFEVYIEKYAEMTPKAVKLLKMLYDRDILDEKAIIDWGKSKPSKKFISKELSATLKSNCAALVNWLETAEEESSDEETDSSDDEDVMEFTEDKPAGIVKVEEPTTETNGHEEVDDEDIDDI